LDEKKIDWILGNRDQITGPNYRLMPTIVMASLCTRLQFPYSLGLFSSLSATHDECAWRWRREKRKL